MLLKLFLTFTMIGFISGLAAMLVPEDGSIWSQAIVVTLFGIALLGTIVIAFIFIWTI